MRLSFEDSLKRLVPACLYYPYKIAKERRKFEPELGLLRELVRPGCTAIDVGANRGFYSYALSKIARRVEAFEPNAALARFARKKLGSSVSVHEVALSDRTGTAKLYVPSAAGQSLHLLGSLRNTYTGPGTTQTIVRLAPLDQFEFADVGFIKIDTEGTEMDVIAGATRTIARDRPVLLVEFLTWLRDAATECIATVQRDHGYAG
jgi:FkbM family methyltransferase